MRRNKILFQIGQAVDQLASSGPDYLIDLTVTAPITITFPEFKAALFKLQYRFLVGSLGIKQGLRVVSRVGNRYHVHFLLRLNTPISQPYNWDLFDRYKALKADYTSNPIPTTARLLSIAKRSLATSIPLQLATLQANIQRYCSKVGLGRCWVLPLRKQPDAIKNYFRKNVPYYRRPEEASFQFFRAWGLSLSPFKSFNPITSWSSNRRANLNQFSSYMGLTNEMLQSTLSVLYSTRWQWLFKDLIASISSPTSNQLLELARIQTAIRLHLLRQTTS